MVLRKVAIAASAGYVKAEDFESFWPSMHKKVDTNVDMTTDEYKSWYRKMKEKNNIV